MYCQIHAGGLRGLEVYIAQVEVDVSRGLPCFDMVGLLASEVKEARERIRVALRNAEVTVPAEKITVNISPADIRKGGTAFDLPVALGIMAAQGMILQERLNGMMVVGELGLNARVRPIRGVLPLVMKAAECGFKECLVPFANLEEADLTKGIAVMGVENLKEAAAYLNTDEENRKRLRRAALLRAKDMLQKEHDEKASMHRQLPDFDMVRGMQEAKYAAMAAAAGFHNMLLCGPPGAGKTLIASCIPSILPPLTKKEREEVSAIYSVAGQLEQGKLMVQRPFISPHHTVSPYALAGGGQVPRPGMVTLAHKGVLFLDEMAEFKRQTLDILRQPMEEGRIFLAKSGGNFIYPADFMLVAATNPCPCGYYPDREHCRCTKREIRRYLSHISGPMLDRIDIFCTVRPVPKAALWKETEGILEEREDSASMQARVIEARQRQEKRYAGTGIRVNGRLGAENILKYCRLGLEQQQFLEQLAETMNCSGRACHRILRLARTLADLDGMQEIANQHLSRAVYYRQSDGIF